MVRSHLSSENLHHLNPSVASSGPGASHTDRPRVSIVPIDGFEGIGEGADLEITGAAVFCLASVRN